jgi:hypothetical protein
MPKAFRWKKTNYVILNLIQDLVKPVNVDID